MLSATDRRTLTSAMRERVTMGLAERAARLRFVVWAPLWGAGVVVALFVASTAFAEPQADTSSPSAEVRLQDSTVFTLHTGYAGRSAEERARAASRALLDAVSAGASGTVRVEPVPGGAVIYADQAPIVQVFPDDARFENDVSFEIYAGRVAAQVKDALVTERRRRAVGQTVFSLSLVVFLGLITLYLLRKSRELTERARAWIDANPERLPALKIRSLQLIGAGPLHTIVILVLSVSKWFLRLVVLYTYLVVVSSMFDATRDYAEKLTGFVVSPISEFTSRLASTVPALVVACVAGVVVLLLVRFVGLFFLSVESGETELSGFPSDLAAPTSVLARSAIVVLALVFAAPLISDTNGALTKVGTFVLLAFALASTPVLANVGVGIGVVFRRQVRSGDYVETGPYKGKVLRVGLLDLLLEEEPGQHVHVPHLWQLFRPLRVRVKDRIS